MYFGTDHQGYPTRGSDGKWEPTGPGPAKFESPYRTIGEDLKAAAAKLGGFFSRKKSVVNASETIIDQTPSDNTLELTSAMKERGPSLWERAKGATANLAATSRDLAASATSKLVSRVSDTGKSLADVAKDPAKMGQLASSVLLGGVVRKFAAAGLVGTGAAGLAVASAAGAASAVVLGHMRDRYTQHKIDNNIDQSPIGWNQPGALVKEFVKFSGFGLKSLATLDHYKSFFTEQDLSVVAKRAVVGAGFGAAGGLLADLLGGDAASHAADAANAQGAPDILSANEQAALSALPDSSHASTVVETAQTAVQKAAAIILADTDASEIAKESAREALNGHGWAQTNMAYFLNNAKDGVDLNQALAHDVAMEAAQNGHAAAEKMLQQMDGQIVHTSHAVTHAAPVAHAPVSAPSPEFKEAFENLPADLAAEIAKETVENTASGLQQAAPVAVEQGITTTQAIAGGTAAVVATGAVAATTQLAAPMAALSLATAEPKNAAPRQSVVAQTCRVFNIPGRPDAYKSECARTPIVGTMREGDKLRLAYTNAATNMSVTYDVNLKGVPSMDTKAFENDFFNSADAPTAINNLRGLAAEKFARATMNTPPATATVGTNDNGITEEAPKRRGFFGKLFGPK